MLLLKSLFNRGMLTLLLWLGRLLLSPRVPKLGMLLVRQLELVSTLERVRTLELLGMQLLRLLFLGMFPLVPLLEFPGSGASAGASPVEVIGGFDF